MQNGRFVWYDLNTKSPDQALEFFTKLFGWGVQEWTPDGAPESTPPYRMLMIGDKAFGGVNAMPDEAPVPSHWLGHVTVPDVDGAVDRAKALGAQFPMDPMDVPGVGRMAIMIDPLGASCSLFTPAVSDEMELIPANTPGMVGWNELGSSDISKHKAFYSEVVGWKWRDSPMPEAGMEYYLFGTGDDGGDAGGLMPSPEGGPAGYWFLYFTCSNIAESAARVTELGGSLAMEPFDVPGVGQLAVAIAPDGTHFGLAEWVPMGD